MLSEKIENAVVQVDEIINEGNISAHQWHHFVNTVLALAHDVRQLEHNSIPKPETADFNSNVIPFPPASTNACGGDAA